MFNNLTVRSYSLSLTLTTLMGFLDKWNVMYARNVKIKMNNLYLKKQRHLQVTESLTQSESRHKEAKSKHLPFWEALRCPYKKTTQVQISSVQCHYIKDPGSL